MLPRPVEEVFAFFSDARNLEAITPPFLRFRILTPMPIEMRAGTRIEYALSLYRVPIRWRTRITRWEPGVCFIDEQEAGAYAYWRHLHEFEVRGARRSCATSSITSSPSVRWGESRIGFSSGARSIASSTSDAT